MYCSNAIARLKSFGAFSRCHAHSCADLLGHILGITALIFATINVVGGYLVTNRMLAMFKRKDEEPK